MPHTCMILAPSQDTAACYTNRAVCYQQHAKFDEIIDDCTAAIAIDDKVLDPPAPPTDATPAAAMVAARPATCSSATIVSAGPSSHARPLSA